MLPHALLQLVAHLLQQAHERMSTPVNITDDIVALFGVGAHVIFHQSVSLLDQPSLLRQIS